MTTLTDTARQQVMRSIVSGEFVAGDVLPSNSDLATRIGCSEATVDRVLRDLARKGVVERIRRKGTVVAAPARASLGQVTLVLSDDAHTNGLLVNPIYKRLQADGFTVELIPAPHSNSGRSPRFSDRTDRRVEIVLDPHSVPTFADDNASSPAQRIVISLDGIPTVRNPHHCYVAIDHRESARQVVDHLLRLGRRRIAVAAGMRPGVHDAASDAAEICRHLIESAGGTYLPIYFHENYLNSLPDLFEKHQVDGYWAIVDHEALMAINVLHRAGWRVPEDLAVVGRNNTPWCQQTVPELTSIDLNASAFASVTSDILCEREQYPSQLHLVTPRLVARASSGC